MGFKDILVTLATYPESTPIAAVRRAVGFAKRLDARLSAIACEVRIQVPGRFEFMANAMLDVPALVATEMKRSAENAGALLAAFKDSAQKEGVLGDALTERCTPAQVPDVFIAQARMRDLTIVPVPEGDHVDQWYAESVLFGSGRPTLIFSETRQPDAPASLDRVTVAWDGSRPAARAVWDALPALRKARDVRILQVVEEGKPAGEKPAEQLVRYLGVHGIAARPHLEHSAGRDVGKVIGAYLESEGVDLLVMGAYGHSKLREFVLGGVTRSMLAHPPVPMILSH